MSSTHFSQLPSPRFRHMLVAAVAILNIAAGGEGTCAKSPQISLVQYEHGVVATTPSDVTYSKRNDLRLTVDTRWTSNFGYRPIRIRVFSRQPAKSEVRIKLRLNIAGVDQTALAIEHSFNLPQGATDAQAIMRFPQFYENDRCWWDVWVDGVRDPDLCAGADDSWNLSATGSPRSSNETLRFALVSKSARAGQLNTTTTYPIGTTTFELADLPTNWLDYSTVDVVALAPRELDQLATTRPAALSALRLWVRAGGQVWVHSVGQNWESLDEVERAFELSTPRLLPAPLADEEAQPSDERDRAISERGWLPLPIGTGKGSQTAVVQHIPTGRVRTIRDPATISRLKLDPNYTVTESPVTPVPVDSPQEHDSSRWYLERPAGLGRVRIFRGGWDPVGFSIAWRMLGGGAPNQPPFDAVPATPVTTAVDTTSDWQSRHGLAPNLANADFPDFLVPGVGLAPVTEFRVLITIFVLVIGPLNYWLLMRANRLHLLLLTVPVLALGLTAALFGYALLSDGLSTKVRVRSFTTLDQAAGEAASWARLSYYAGLAPGGGLAFDDDVALYPIRSGWEISGDAGASEVNELRQLDDQQVFAGGWLRSRVPTQFLSVRARKTPARLQLDRAGEKLFATNKLGARIRYVAVVDESGQVYAGESIDEAARVELQVSSHADALRVLRAMMLEHQPAVPPELAGTHASESDASRRGRRFFADRFDQEYGVERLSENLLSSAIAGLVASNAENVLNIPRRTYIAITETGPEIELGLSTADEEASFHVLHGTW